MAEVKEVYIIISEIMEELNPYKNVGTVGVTGGTCNMANNMTDAAREARREYKRRWSANNKDKVKAQQERYWNKKAREAAADQQTQPVVVMEG